MRPYSYRLFNKKWIACNDFNWPLNSCVNKNGVRLLFGSFVRGIRRLAVRTRCDVTAEHRATMSLLLFIYILFVFSITIWTTQGDYGHCTLLTICLPCSPKMVLILITFYHDSISIKKNNSRETLLLYVICVQALSYDCGKLFKTNTKWLIPVEVHSAYYLPWKVKVWKWLCRSCRHLWNTMKPHCSVADYRIVQNVLERRRGK